MCGFHFPESRHMLLFRLGIIEAEIQEAVMT